MDQYSRAPDSGNGGGDGAFGGRRRRKWIGWGVVAAAVVIYAIPYFYTANPRACASCHRMEPYYRSWRASSHRLAASNCLACHVRQSTLSLVVYRLMFYRELAAQATGMDLKPWGTTIPGVESCHRSGCHSLNRLASTSGDLKISHREHVVRAHIVCIKCHPGAAHRGVGKRFLIPPRKLCKGCHAAQMNNCSYCHVRDVSRAPDGEH